MCRPLMKCCIGRHFTGLQIRVRTGKLIFLFLNQNMINELMGKEINAILGAQTILIWTYDFLWVYSLPMYLLPVSRKKRVKGNETKKSSHLQLWQFLELYNGEVLKHQDCLYPGTELQSAVLPAYSVSRN